MNINDVIDGMNIIVIIFDFYNIIKIGVKSTQSQEIKRLKQLLKAHGISE